MSLDTPTTMMGFILGSRVMEENGIMFKALAKEKVFGMNCTNKYKKKKKKKGPILVCCLVQASGFAGRIDGVVGGLVATREIVSRLGGVVMASIIQGAITNGCWHGCAFEHGLRLGSRNASQAVGEEEGAITDHGDEDVDRQEQKTRSMLLLRDAVSQIGVVFTHLFVDAGETLFGIGTKLDFLLVMALDLLGELVERRLDTVLDLQNIPLGGKGTSKLSEFSLD